jgi:hypothetical protein
MACSKSAAVMRAMTCVFELFGINELHAHMLELAGWDWIGEKRFCFAQCVNNVMGIAS